MKKRFKIVSTLLACVVIILSVQTATSADKLAKSDTDKNIQENAEEPDSDRTLVHTITEDQMRELTMKLNMIAKVEKKNLVEYIDELTGLGQDTARMIIDRCEEVGLDPFVVLAIIRVESNFNTYTVGALGERGLGQLMANTAEPVAARLGVAYDPDKLFEPAYNVLLFTTQLKYLYEFYDWDFHKTLTAYNRGQYGLEKYIASRSSYINPEVSDYSMMILDFATKYKYEFDNQ